MKRRMFVVMAAILASGCGYFLSGEWQDDPANWERAFGARVPSGVTVVYSCSWRSPHWSYEAAHLFELEATPAFRTQLIAQNQLRQVAHPKAADFEGRCVAECPGWFMPKPPASYEVWTSEQPRNSLRVFIDRATGHIFFGDYQL